MTTCVREWNGTTYHVRVNKQQTTSNTLFSYDTKYKVLICKIHKYAVDDPEFHLKELHCVTGPESDGLVQDWLSLDLCTAKGSRVPPNNQEERTWLAPSVKGFSCRGINCRFLTNEYSNLVAHWSSLHYLNLRDVPLPTFDTPKSYAKCVRVQTLFPSPNEKWFTVVPPHKLCGINQLAVPLDTHQATEGHETQFLHKGERQVHSNRHSYMHRLPAEIRNQIYELALASNVTYHLEDMLAPARYDDDCEEDDEAEELDADDYRPHYQFRCMIEKDIKGFYQNGRSHKLRAISLSSECRHPVGLLQTCSLIYHEASSIFYSRNRFLIHSRWANWTSVNHFLDLLRPETRRCIQSLGVLRLRPTVHSNPKPRGHHSRQSALYYSSMKTFLDDFIPQLSLRSLLVHVNLIDLYYEPNHELSYSPQAPWLNAFLRLPFDTIDIRVEYEGFDINIDNLHDTPGRRLVDRVNAIDFRTRLRAKWLHHDGDYNGVPLWWTDVPVDERVGRRDAMEIYKSKLGAYSMLDIWAQCATDASKGVMAEASNPYEDGADEICV